jgi:hypothetical protein
MTSCDGEIVGGTPASGSDELANEPGPAPNVVPQFPNQNFNCTASTMMASSDAIAPNDLSLSIVVPPRHKDVGCRPRCPTHPLLAPLANRPAWSARPTHLQLPPSPNATTIASGEAMSEDGTIHGTTSPGQLENGALAHEGGSDFKAQRVERIAVPMATKSQIGQPVC